MNHRLDAPMGLLIDRNKRVSFSFEGKDYSGFAGDSIASALAGNGRWLLSRSFKYHRPRGPLTMAGQDANTLIQLDKEPNVLADREPATEAPGCSARITTARWITIGMRCWDISPALCRWVSTTAPSTRRRC
ncbi:(2Fe-2S)-binding protein [Oceanisphaera psychrotolerans]|uniref:(2Fe-2S)-binding protein n=1 Tax=Oceanisphaera psychrotolerans TaxID=1414654 RepID=UPI000A4B1C27|nr:(2Fe-2S)-binding protein [Oceanisphaera psychrotolerans]